MVIEICMAVIAVTLIGLVIALMVLSSKMQKSIHTIQTDLSHVSVETTRLLKSLDEFVRADLHKVSKETQTLISKLQDLTDNIGDKTHLVSALLKPMTLLNSSQNLDSSNEESLTHTALPQIAKWVGSGVFLIKSIKEFFNHEKK